MNPNILLKEIQDGNQESFKRLFYLYYDPLVVYAEKYLYDRGCSEDIVQEAFIYIWENAKAINLKTSFEAYLYRMIRNRSLNYLKTIRITDDLEILKYTGNDQVEDHLQEEIITKLTKVLILVENMPKRMKAVFDLKYRQHRSYAEISTELGISTNTIKTQLRRAKSLLQNHFPFYFFVFYLHLF